MEDNSRSGAGLNEAGEWELEAGRERVATTTGTRASLAQDFFEPGRNCWRVAHAKRVAVLVDGEEYYGAVRQLSLIHL